MRELMGILGFFFPKRCRFFKRYRFFWEIYIPILIRQLEEMKGEIMTRNALSKLLRQFVLRLKINQEELATKLGITRRSLYTAMSPDKDVDSFKIGLIRKISAIFPITIVISRGQIRIFRWYFIAVWGFENDQ